MTSPDPKVAVLRSAGHTDAAALLESLNAMEQPAPTPPAEQDQQPPTASSPALNPAEAQREQEGRAVLEAMRRAGILDRFETETTT